MYTIEILQWRSAAGISDQSMINAVEAMVPDLRQLPGFRYQTLVKSANGDWMDIYWWDSKEDAHRSNELMANTQSLANLLKLIEPDSVSIEVIPALQQSSTPSFNQQ